MKNGQGRERETERVAEKNKFVEGEIVSFISF
jgi:hypothetical protein